MSEQLDFSDIPNANPQQSGGFDFSGLPNLNPEQASEYQRNQKYGTLPQALLATGERFAKGVAGPIATAAERGLSKIGVPGLSPEDQEQREQEYPILGGLAETAGLAGPALLTGGTSLAEQAPEALRVISKFSQPALLTKAGEAATSALGLGGAGASVINKIGSSAVSGAIENALYSAGDIGSKIINGQNPSEAIETAIPYVGLSALAGGALGAGLGAVPELWKASQGPETGGILRAITDKLGGRETNIPDNPISKALETVGVEPKPEIISALSSDPSIQLMAKTLEQSDATSAGQAYQESLKEFNNATHDAISNAVGKTPEELSNLPEISKYEDGKNIGETLANEYQRKLDPTIKEFEDLKGKYKDAPLVPNEYIEIPSKDIYQPFNTEKELIPGTASQISDKLASLANQEGWIGGDKDIQNELNRVLKALPDKQTLGELSQLITQVGNNTKSTLPFGMQTPLSRAGQLIKNVLRDAEDDIAIKKLGEKGPELVTRFQNARAAYKTQANLQSQLNDRLRIGGSVSGFAKGLKEMARTDGEGVLRKLSGRGDANLLEFLSQNFPETAQKIKDYHLNDVLKNSVDKAKPGELFSITRLQKSIDSMSPELRQFAIPTDLQTKLEAMKVLQDQLNRVPHNFSNTARTASVLNKYGMGTAMGMVSLLTGHGVASSLIAGELAHTLSKTAPDATRLAILKFIGSKEQISSTGFKAMYDFIKSAQKGDNLLLNASKAFFKAGSKVIPDEMIPNVESRDKLEKNLEYINNNPNSAINVAGSIGHYLPDHATAAASTLGSATAYLSSIKPAIPPANALDEAMPIDKIAVNKYNRALDIAQQPLLVIKHAKEGTLLPQDVDALQKMYPSLYQSITNKLTEQLIEHKSKGEKLPYSSKVGLNLLLGGNPIDGTMTPASIQAILHSASPPTENGQQIKHHKSGSSNTSISQINKVNKLFTTPLESLSESKRQ